MSNLTLGAFYGIDSVIDFLVAIVAVLIFYQSNKVYRILNEKKYFYFSWAFFSIAIAYIFKILTNVTATHKIIIQQPNFVVQLLVESKSMQLFHFTSIILFKFFLVVGFLTLFLITKKSTKKEDVPLFIYLSAVAVLFSIYFNFIFHLTLVIILSQLTSHFYENCKNKKTPYTRRVLLAFILILLSAFINIFYGFHHIIYILAEIILLAGFLLLLINHMKLQNGKEKNKTRSDKRSSRNPKKR